MKSMNFKNGFQTMDGASSKLADNRNIIKTENVSLLNKEGKKVQLTQILWRKQNQNQS